jgi:hypothetical protein
MIGACSDQAIDRRDKAAEMDLRHPSLKISVSRMRAEDIAVQCGPRQSCILQCLVVGPRITKSVQLSQKSCGCATKVAKPCTSA